MENKLIKYLSFTLSLLLVHAVYAEPFMLLTSTDIADNGPLPTRYTCDGSDVSPQLSWQHVPANAVALAIVVTDLNATRGNFYHWIVYNIPTHVRHFERGITNLPSGSVTGLNNFENAQYNGPCPPNGETHAYVFTLYALDSKLTFPPTTQAADLVAAIESHSITKAILTTIYGRS